MSPRIRVRGGNLKKAQSFFDMPHLVVTVPKWFWPEWIAEGDAAGDPASGQEWGYTVGTRPPILPGERLYIVSHGLLRGYAPVTRVVPVASQHCSERTRYVICRESNAVAVTIVQPIQGFRGFRKIWWSEKDEQPFPDWKTRGVKL